jgi:hypothetical protein
MATSQRHRVKITSTNNAIELERKMKKAAAIETTDTINDLEIEIEELEAIAAPQAITKLAVNHNETFVGDQTL